MTEKIIYLKINEIIAPKLGFRDSAETFFQELEEIEQDIIKLDFKGVKFISRSFAHEYLQQKKKSKKHIIETNLPTKVVNMFDYVKNSIKNPNKKQLEPIRRYLS